jgi:hypothetical protein
MVEDQGIGISRDDLKRLQRVGQATDASRLLLLAAMPMWLRPSGIFGIGLQSLFLVTREIQLESRSLLTGQRLRIRLVRSGQAPAFVLVGEDPHPAERSFGTTVSCFVELDRVPHRLRWSRVDVRTMKLLSNYDAITDADLPVQVANIEDRVASYAETSWVPIMLSGEVVSRPQDEALWYFDEPTSIRIQLIPIRPVYTHDDGDLLYRGAYVRGLRVEFLFYAITADVLAGTAEDILTVARDELREDTRHQTINSIEQASLRAIMARAKALRASQQNPTELAAASAVLFLWGLPQQAVQSGTEWRSLVIESTRVTLGQIADSASFVLEENELDAEVQHSTIAISISAAEMTIKTSSRRWTEGLLALGRRSGFSHVQIMSIVGLRLNNTVSPRILRISKSPIDAVGSDDVLRSLMEMGAALSRRGRRKQLRSLNQSQARSSWWQRVGDYGADVA